MYQITKTAHISCLLRAIAIILIFYSSASHSWENVKALETDINNIYDKHFGDYKKLLKEVQRLESKITSQTSEVVKLSYQCFLLSAYTVAAEWDKAEYVKRDLLAYDEDKLDITTLALIHNSLSFFHANRGEINLTKKHAELGLSFATQAQDQDYIFLARIHIGQAYSVQHNYDQALSYLKKAYDMDLQATRLWVSLYKPALFDRLASLYSGMREYDKALEIYLSLIPLAEKYGNKAEFASLYYNLGSAYRHKGSYKLAKEYLRKSAENALAAGNESLIAFAAYGQSMINYKLKEYEETIENARHARDLFQRLDKQHMAASAKFQLALAYDHLGKIQSAEINYLEALETFEEVGNKNAVLNVAQFLRDMYERAEQFQKALEFSKMAFFVYQEQYNEKKESLMQELKADFEEREGVLKAKLLSQENAIQKIELDNKKQELNNQRIRLTVMALLLGLVVLFSIRLFSSERKLKKLARLDHISGSYNKRYILKLGQEEVTKALRNRDILTVVLVDIDDFTSLNKHLGYEKGNNLLSIFASCISTQLRQSDAIARYSGDRFLLVFAHTSGDEAKQVIQAIREEIVAFNWSAALETNPIDQLSACFGISVLDESTEHMSFKNLIENAGVALEDAKKQGRNTIVSFGGEDRHESA